MGGGLRTYFFDSMMLSLRSIWILSYSCSHFEVLESLSERTPEKFFFFFHCFDVKAHGVEVSLADLTDSGEVYFLAFTPMTWACSLHVKVWRCGVFALRACFHSAYLYYSEQLHMLWRKKWPLLVQGNNIDLMIYSKILWRWHSFWCPAWDKKASD